MSDLVSIRDRARFSGPNSRVPVVARTRLDEHFRAATGQVIRVLAPGGYGKSTIVARWVADDPRPTRWLELESIDNDPLVLSHALVRGLSDLGPPRSEANVVYDVGALAEGTSEPFILVLDDIHLINSEASTALIDRVVKHLPMRSTLVLVGRAHHHSAMIAPFRLDPGVVDVTAAQLAFDLAETEQLLASIGVEADIDVLTALTDQFEGWPAGLRLAGIVMTSRHQGLDLPVEQLGDLECVTEYITREWFGSFGPSDQRFLTEVACLGRFTGETCDFVLGVTDSATTVRRLCRDELVISALDQHGKWYRLHPLLRRWLSSRLRSVDRARWCEIHVAAARWWEREGDIDLAIGYVADAGEFDVCEELVLQHAAAFNARGMRTTVERWLTMLGDERIRSSPGLGVIACLVDIDRGDGDRALQWARLAWQEIDRTDRGHGIGDLQTRLQAEVVLAALETCPAAELAPIALDAHRRLPPGPWQAIAGLVLGGNWYLCDDDRAIDTLRQSLFEADVAGLTTLHANAAASLAAVLDLEGRRDESIDLAARAVRLLASRLAETFLPTVMSAAITSLHDARAGRHERASEQLAEALGLLDGFDRCAPWFNLLALVTLARTCLLLDDAPMARELLRRLDRKMETQDPNSRVAAHVDDLREDVRRAFELLADRSWSLTAAELRIAQYLPTNLSLAEIATRLFVSRNTVKSHAAAIYRKLGTSSRSEAVELARRAGLIDEGATGA